VSLGDVIAHLKAGGQRCDRCRREQASQRLDLRFRPPTTDGEKGTHATTAKVLADVCDGCAAAILTAVARAVGQLRPGPRDPTNLGEP
jgi:NMD protein affecting ribosome stability and mRNA decay